MHEARVTRYGPVSFAGGAQAAAAHEGEFRAVPGPAELVLRGDGIDGVQITVNGRSVVGPGDFRGAGEGVVPVPLERQNTIAAAVPAGNDGALQLRVTQTVQADLRIQRQGYFGLNTTDMARQRAFYELLGFKGEIYPAGPERSTSFARSLGFEDDYLIYVSLHSLEDPPVMPFVDTVQFRGESYRSEPPYARLNHLGMTYASYATADLDGAFAYLADNGVAFLSPPATAPNGERFVFLKDQDGTFLKLVEASDGRTPAPGANLLRLVNTNMNVSDLERSREFYRLLGFSESAPGSLAGDGAFSAAHGFDGPIAFEGEDVSLGEGTDGATIQLRQWLTPYDGAPPYAPPVNHLGIDRINFYVEDLTAVIATMNELGFEQLGPVGGSPEIGIVFFFDPDGIKVQFAGPQRS